MKFQKIISLKKLIKVGEFNSASNFSKVLIVHSEIFLLILRIFFFDTISLKLENLKNNLLYVFSKTKKKI